MRSIVKLPWLLVAGFSLFLLTRPAFSQTPYYAGKTITLVRGGGPGGSGEFQSRALMPYLKKYIPGNPTITMECMDGASGRKGANYIYTAKPDGLKIGSAGAMIPGPILGLPGSNYDISTNLSIPVPLKPAIRTRFLRVNQRVSIASIKSGARPGYASARIQ